MTKQIEPATEPKGESGYKFEKSVAVPMRDGTRLAANIWLPNDSTPAPTLLMRTPYGKDSEMGRFNLSDARTPEIGPLTEAGYAVVVQDCRGTFSSEGDFEPLANEADDGLDTVEWLRAQPWCNGDIGMFGTSYHGYNQWAIATQGVVGLKAIAPAVTSPDFYTGVFFCRGGVMARHATQVWTTVMALNAALRDGADADDVNALTELLVNPPLSSDPADHPALDRAAPWWRDWTDRPSRDEYWRALSLTDRLDQVDAPAMHVAGWFDFFVTDQIEVFERMKTEGRTEAARRGQQLLIGPWDHMHVLGIYPEMDFGPAAGAAATGLTQAHLAFFDRWVRGNHGTTETAPVRIFVMGINQWRDEPDWPLPDTTYVPYYLDSAGSANTAAGDGILTTEAIQREATDTFVYNPHSPVPSMGGRIAMPAVLSGSGPADQTAVESRDDVLVYTSAELAEPVEVTGSIALSIFVSSSARDTDFTGKLVDVHSDGRALYLADGIMRGRYRQSLSEPEDLEPGQVYEITIDLGPTSNVFLAGHRIRLEVSSSSFPRFERNTNTGGNIFREDPEKAISATNSVLHGPQYPSRLLLPIIQR